VLLQGKYFASQPVPASFGSVNYWGVHAFAFVNAKGERQMGKWIFEPVGGTQGLTDDEAKAKGASFLFTDLRERVVAGAGAAAGAGVAFDLNLQLAQAGDRIDSAVVPLPSERRKVNLGRLVIKAVAADATGECLTITYNPIVLPKGVEASADPMLAARAAPYGVGLGRRISEGAKQ
jgi:catalase